MAEAVGLVIGGVALAGLYSLCKEVFNDLDAGRNCGKQYAEAALEITLLGQRLTRWAKIYARVRPNSSREEGEAAKAALEAILRDLREAEAVGARYAANEPRSHESDAIASITETMQKTTVAAARPNVPNRIRWALGDRARVQRNIEHMTGVISSLEAISNNALAKHLWEACDAAALDLVQPSSIEEPDERGAQLPGNATTILQEAAEKVDPQFNDAIASRSHTYTRWEISDEAKIHPGDYVASGEKVTGYGHKYDDFKIKGKAVVMAGNTYGGKSVFD